MKKLKTYKLSIKNPCTEDWDLMQSNMQGKYCSNCSKSVVDFTNLTDQQIINIIKHRDGNICGRFVKNQLNIPLIEQKETSSNKKLARILSTLILLSSTKNLSAQTNKVETKIQRTFDTSIKSKDTIDTLKNDEKSLMNILRGRIIDFLTQKPIPFSSVIIQNTRLGVAADANGFFKIVMPDSILNQKFSVRITCVGYKPFIFSPKKKQITSKREFIVSLKKESSDEDTVIVAGGVTVEE